MANGGEAATFGDGLPPAAPSWRTWRPTLALPLALALAWGSAACDDASETPPPGGGVDIPRGDLAGGGGDTSPGTDAGGPGIGQDATDAAPDTVEADTGPWDDVTPDGISDPGGDVAEPDAGSDTGPSEDTSDLGDAPAPPDVESGPDADADPGADAPVAVAEAVINEVVTKATAGGDDWVELANTSATDSAPLGGYTLTDNAGNAWTFPDGTAVPAGGYVVVDSGTLGFDLGDDDTLTLTDAAGEPVDVADWDAGDAPEGASWGRYPDATGPFQTLFEVTLNAANVLGTPPGLCGDGTCDPAAGETCESCPGDCTDCAGPVCGDATCGAGETCESCPDDCGDCPGPACGDGVCEGDETCESCADDCGDCPGPVCGDGSCEGGETCENCVGDCGPCPTFCASDLFLSEYVEGTSFDKAVEVANFTGGAVDLSAYAIWKISNGGDWTEGADNALPLTGTLAHGDVVVLCHSSFSSPDLCDVLQGGQSLNFNGDDAVGLAKSGILVDAVGEQGPSVGTAWDVAGVVEATQDHTLRRKGTVLSGSVDWVTAAATQWDVWPLGTLDGLGSHAFLGVCEGDAPAPECGDGTCDPSESCADCETDCGPCAEAGDCCVASEVGGCSDPECEALVCAMDSFCCDNVWDSLCADAATVDCEICAGPPSCGDGTCDDGEGCDSCSTDCGECPEVSGCCDAGELFVPGCDDAPCEATVCALDPYCCEVEWDTVCAGYAADACGDLCPAIVECGDGACDASEDCETCPGDCGEPVCTTATPGVTGCADDAACEALVCEFDGECCSVEWGEFCTLVADLSCGECPEAP